MLNNQVQPLISVKRQDAYSLTQFMQRLYDVNHL